MPQQLPGLVQLAPDDQAVGPLGDDPCLVQRVTLLTSGFGLRYRTPIGPIRLDFGFPLDRTTRERRFEPHFSIGHAF